MSVEETRKEIRAFAESLDCEYGDGPACGEPEIRAPIYDSLLDRLILEVQAAMPCWRQQWSDAPTGWYTLALTDCTMIIDVEECPSCTAREALGVTV